ncbi:TonB-dependent receptor [Desulfobacter postgatei]|uniref:TonB-dependent receptor n=1 Tax=Desulfobacter postgatei TaxID=2293 RepID=UPI00259B516B|nr:TonB-dependent receptor [uncultured Desulfobacter sp.]
MGERVRSRYKVGPLGYSLAGSYQDAEPYLWNNDFEGKNLAASATLDMPLDGQASFGFQYTNSKRGFIRENRLSDNPDDPGFYTRVNDDYPLAFGETFSPNYGNAFIPGPGAYWDKTKYYIDLGYSQPIANAMVDFKIYKNIEDRKEKNYSSSSLNSGYADGELVLDREVASDRSYGGSLEVTSILGSHEILGGMEHKVLAYGDTTANYVDKAYNNSWWSVPDYLLSYEPSSEGICWGYYVQDTWKISDNWILTGGLRYDQYKNEAMNGSTDPELDDSALTPKLTVTWKFSPVDTLTASAYQAYRTPGLPETYWWANGDTGGDPVLKPEKNNAVEFLYRRDFAKWAFMRISAYHYSVDDYIMFRYDPNWQGVYNIDKAKIYGASLDGRIKFTDRISGNAAVTWQQSEKQGDIYDTAGLLDEIDYLPEWKVSAGLEFKLPWESVLSLTARYVGERSTIYAYSVSSGWPAVEQTYFKKVDLDGYVTADVNFKIPINKHAELSCYIENLFDEGYEEQYGYPMPGIIAGAAIKFSL